MWRIKMSHSNNDQSYISKRTFKAFDTEKEDDEYIFVSYSHKDADEVFPELLRFHEEGYNIWYDEGIFGGTKWKQYIGKNLIGSSLFVVFISANSMASDNVKTEIAIAKDAGIPIIPIYIEFIELDLDLKYDLILYQGIFKFEMSSEQYDSNWKRSFERYVSKAKQFLENDVETILEDEVCNEDEPKSDVEENIEEGYSQKEQYDFKYLDELIHGGQVNIDLNFDVLLDDSEQNDFNEGILLDVDDMTINGNNHIVDARKFSRVFHITGKNVTISNITFKGGFANNKSGEKHEDGGGAIYVDRNASLNLVKCNFLENYSDSDGGALFNKGKSNLQLCKFENNASKTSGGAIANFNSLDIIKSVFKQNESVNGGALYNYYDSTLSMSYCKVRENTGIMFAGGIYNYADLKIEDVTFKNNVSEIGGGAILNYGIANISGATFRKNTSNFGGSVFNMSLNKLNIYSHDSSSFQSDEGSIELNNCVFGNNHANKLGGAVCNLSKCKMVECIIGNNSADVLGNIISNGPEGILNQTEDVADMENYYLSILNISQGDIKIKDMLLKNAIYNQKNCLLKVSRGLEVNGSSQDGVKSDIFLNKGKFDFY